MIAVSNIAWPAEVEAQALDLITDLGLKGLEVAPTKAFGSYDAEAGKRYQDTISSRGLPIVSMQSLFYGVQDAHLFRSGGAQTNLIRHLRTVARLAAALSCPVCVFGSPGLRDPGDLTPAQAEQVALRVFREVGDVFGEFGVLLALEANPAAYGCKFLTNTADAYKFVTLVGHPHIRLQIDTGTAIANGTLVELTAGCLSAGAHLHISEPHLKTIGPANEAHRKIAALVHSSDYSGWKSIEMLATPNWEQALRTAAQAAETIYGGLQS